MQALPQGSGTDVHMHDHTCWTVGDASVAISGRDGSKLLSFHGSTMTVIIAILELLCWLLSFFRLTYFMLKQEHARKFSILEFGSSHIGL